MKWDELPLMMVRNRDDEDWRGPYHVLEMDTKLGFNFLALTDAGEPAFTFKYAKPYTEPQHISEEEFRSLKVGDVVSLCERSTMTREIPLWYTGKVLQVYADGIHVRVGYMNGSDALCREEIYSIVSRAPVPKMRPMTRDEVLAWACSAEALGWVVREDDNDATIRPPQYFAYLHESTHYRRSRASASGDYKWEKFEVEVGYGRHNQI